MTLAIADTTVVVHLYRRYPPALTWYGSLMQPLGLTPITWLEVIYGAGSKAKQAACKILLNQFTLLHLSSVDQDWAIEQMERYRLSHGLSVNDCLARVPFAGAFVYSQSERHDPDDWQSCSQTVHMKPL